MNYYEILGVRRDAAAEEIEKAYRALARKVHPDLNGGGDPARAESRMKQLNEIRDTLGDPLLRLAYDAQLRREREDAAAARRAAEAPPPADYARAQTPFTATMPVQPHSRWPRVAVLLSAALVIAVGGVVFGRAQREVEPASPDGVPDVDPNALDELPARPPTSAIELPSPTERRLLPAVVPPAASLPPRSRPDDERRGPHASVRVGRVHSTLPGSGGVVKVGSTAAEVIRKFGPPHSTEPGSRPGNVVFVYGQLRLELRSGVVVGGTL